MIDNKVLTFKRNDSRMDILINKLCEVQSKEPSTLVFTYSKERNQWETHTVNLSGTNEVTQNNPIFVAREAKKIVLESLSEEKNPKSNKG